MGQRRIENRNIRKLSRVGGGTSYSITLPIEVVRAFGWKEKQKLEIEVDKKRKKIIIKDWKK